MAYTPMKYSLSSVFLTPDSETKSPVVISHTTPRPLPSLAILLSPIETPKRDGAKEAPDVLSGLIEAGVPRSADSILAHLSPSDIIACMRVSHKWNTMVTSRQNLMEKAISYRKLCKSNAENEHKTADMPSRHQIQLPRQPLSIISSNIQLDTRKRPPSHGLPLTKHHHHHPCPHCWSPAQALNHRRVECPRCQLDFCANCFHQWHEGECHIRSPKRPQSNAMVGTQQCKKRLRRL
eukprot:Em0009g63a